MKCLLCNRDLKECSCTVRPAMVNTRGQLFIYGFMLGLTIILLALGLAFPIRESTDNAMNATSENSIGLDCNNESISSFDKISCYATDLTPFYFVGSIIVIGGVIFGSKIIFG